MLSRLGDVQISDHAFFGGFGPPPYPRFPHISVDPPPKRDLTFLRLPKTIFNVILLSSWFKLGVFVIHRVIIV